MTEGIITIAIVKRFSKRGGAYVSVPSNLIDKEVYIVPKDRIAGIIVQLKEAAKK